MSEKRTSLEVIAPSVEEAVAQGLADLGLTEADVEVEILDGGSRGLFGLGSRQSRVRLTIRAAVGEIPDVPAPAQAAPAPVEAQEEMPDQEVLMLEEADLEEEAAAGAPEEKPSIETEIALHVARETVMELLERMKIQGDVSARFVEAEDGRGRTTLHVDIEGDDLSILIGPRAETLNALQYIASLIVGKELGRSLPMTVDVQGYRQRRAQQIRQLARRMADQAIKTGKRQYLEPMPASERRLVHIELRNHSQVTTESIGDEPRRKVTIIPKA